MAAQTQDARVVLQPTPQEAPLQTNVFDLGAGTLGQIGQMAGQEGQAAQQEAGRQGQRAGQYFARAINFASSAFDQVLSTYNKYAEQKAIEDAPASIKRDGNQNLIPPTSFYPPGISTRAYGETYANTSIALYKSYAEQELIQHSALLKEKYPNDPVAYTEGMRTKRQAMMQNLDPRVAPWIEVRAEQVQAQGTTQIAVAVQSEQNLRTRQQYDRDKQGIIDDAGRMAANTQIGQGGGGSQTGVDNNSGNITLSGDQYAGGKGLPFKYPGNAHTFETFQSAEHGVAAHYSLIRKKVDQAGGTLSFAELVNKWDPNGKPEVKANYAAALADSVGANPDDAVPIGNSAHMAAVIKAQNRFEKGKQTVSDAAIDNGIKLANGDKTVPLTNQATGAVTLADPKAMAQAAEQALNVATIVERINNMRTLGKAQGKSDTQINYEIREQIAIPAQTPGDGRADPQLGGSTLCRWQRPSRRDRCRRRPHPRDRCPAAVPRPRAGSHQHSARLSAGGTDPGLAPGCPGPGQ